MEKYMKWPQMVSGVFSPYAAASAQHSTGMANWPNTIQCLGSDDIMSLGIKSSAFLRVKETEAQKFEVQICGF